MKKSLATDKILIGKILKYTDDIRECLARFSINSYNDFETDRFVHFAITQIITNIHEIKKNMQQATLEKLICFDKIKISAARNIASHDYDSINFKIIYDICKKLTSEEVEGVLRHEYNNL